MYRLLIVDDETYIVDWISGLIEVQQDLDLDICRAYSATEALKWLERAKIDIIIADIRMPDMSGITLVSKVKQNWPGCKVIFLTAHADFDYAYEAIKNDVISYILKTEDDSRILEEVRKAVRLLDGALRHSQLLEELNEHIYDSMSVLRKEALLKLLKGEYANEESLPEIFRCCSIRLNIAAPYILFVARIQNLRRQNSISEGMNRFNAVHKIVEHYLCESYVCYHVEYEYDKIAWLVQPASEYAGLEQAGTGGELNEKTITFIKGMLETIQQSCRETLHMEVSFVMNCFFIGKEQTAERFCYLNGLLNRKCTEKNSFIMTDTAYIEMSDIPGIISESSRELLHIKPDMAEKLRLYLENGRREEFLNLIGITCKELRKVKSWNNNSALEAYFYIALVLISYINQKGLTEKIAFKIGLNRLFRPQMEESWASAVEYIYSLTEIIFNIRQDDNGQLYSNMANFIKQYIQDHITEDVSLVRLSEVTGYNATYISRFFKEVTGITLNVYIATQRLRKIRELMEDQTLNIGDVSEKAGFDSRTYFNRFVRKTTGLTPQKYRKMLQTQGERM